MLIVLGPHDMPLIWLGGTDVIANIHDKGEKPLINDDNTSTARILPLQKQHRQSTPPGEVG